MIGYFSIIQYCPDPSRAEAANVGFVLLSPDQDFLGARITTNHDRVRRFFGTQGQTLDNLKWAETSLINRITGSREALLNFEALGQFARTRVNDLRMTPLTSINAPDPKALFDDLFAEFVGRPVTRNSRRSKLRHHLDSLFAPYADRGAVQVGLKIELPVLKRIWDIDYAYMNGVMNYVRVQSVADRRAESEALRSITEWDLIKKHDPKSATAKLIVPMPIPVDERQEQNRFLLAELFSDFDVQTVFEEDLDGFRLKVESDLARH